MRITVGLLAILAVARPTSGSVAPDDVATVLRRQTQEMLDAITTGATPVWARYLDERVSYVTEDGVIKTKRQMVNNIRPLPKEISGDIRIVEFRVTVHGDVAMATHVDDEHETFHGHRLHCQYVSTDTWQRTSAGWRLVGSQVMALRADPPAVALSVSDQESYVGRYSLAPELSYEIRRKGGLLLGQETGRKLDTLRAETRDVLFVPGKPRYRKVFRRDTAGRIVDFAERREAWDLVWVRAR